MIRARYLTSPAHNSVAVVTGSPSGQKPKSHGISGRNGMRGSEAEVGLELNFVNWVLFSSLLRVPGEEPSGGILLLGA